MGRILLNIHSNTLHELFWRGVFNVDDYQSYVEFQMEVEAEEGEPVSTFPSVAQESMSCSIVIAAFMRSCAQARIQRVLLGDRRVEASLAGRKRQPALHGCSALATLDVRHAALGAGGVDLIRGVWDVTTRSFCYENNNLLGNTLPPWAPVDLDGCEEFEGATPTTQDLAKVFSLSAERGARAFRPRRYGANAFEVLSDPDIQAFVRCEPDQADIDRFSEYLACEYRNDEYFDEDDGEPIDLSYALNPERMLMAGCLRALRTAAFDLLTATRILTCRVGFDTETTTTDSPRRTHWLMLPTEIRRACLEAVPMLSSATAEEKIDMMAHLPPPLWRYRDILEGYSMLSTRSINRIFAFGADRRTIGFGMLPEAALCAFRTASDANKSSEEPMVPVLGVPNWSFSASRRHWKPLDSRSEWQAKQMKSENVSLPWEAECFIRAIGLYEDILELLLCWE